MEYIKLQVGCLLIFLYILWMYIKESLRYPLQPFFRRLSGGLSLGHPL